MYVGAWDILELADDMTMNFTSGYFLCFLAVAVLMYYMVSAKDRWIVLLIGSFVFETVGGGIQVILYPLIMSVFVYNAAVIIENTGKEQRKKRRLCLTVAVLILTAVLALIKCDTKFNWKFINVLFPIGISYYTFSLIGYLADVYWGRDKAERNLLRLILFVIYFPKMIQGPISRHKDLAGQLAGKHYFSYQNFCFGLQLMVWGFFKKLVIAERAGIVVSQVIDNYQNYGGCILFTAVMLSAVQMYCDFSGYMDIATGMSQILGIGLEQNFDHPFFSKSAAEFWRRWHMTLGTWFKDYVYMPLVISPKLIKLGGWVRKHIGKTAGKAVMTVVPLTIVWILTGLWHGTGVNYIAWGIYWGSIIIFSTLCSKKIKRLTEKLHINTEAPSWKFFQIVRTFLLFCFGRLITVPGNLAVSVKILKKVFTQLHAWELVDGTIYTIGLDRINFQLMLFCIGVVWTAEMIQERCRIRESIAKWNFAFRCLFYCMALWAVMVFGLYGPDYNAKAFLYMGF